MTLGKKYMLIIILLLLLLIIVTDYYLQDSPRVSAHSPSDHMRVPHTGHAGSMQPVDDQNQTYIFSAYVDKTDGKNVVRVIGIVVSNSHLRPTLICILWRDGDSQTVDATLTVIPQSRRHRYTATFIFCPINKHFGTPTHVTIVSRLTVVGFNRVVVQTSMAAPEVNFTMCLPPLQNNYDDLHQLLEYIVVNRLFGADFFVFYNFSVSARVSRALEMFVSQGLAEVVPWGIPQHVEARIHYYGQLVAANDCMYRHRHRTRYMVNTDLDEFIVPRKSDSWMSMIQPVLTASPLAAAYYVRSYLFCTCWKTHPDDFPQKPTALKYQIQTLTKTTRTALAMPKNIRQKYIFDPKRVEIVGIHYIWKHLPGFKHVYMDIDVASVNHYRVSQAGPFRPNEKLEQSRDTYMHSFQDTIAGGIEKRWRDILLHIGPSLQWGLHKHPDRSQNLKFQS